MDQHATDSDLNYCLIPETDVQPKRQLKYWVTVEPVVFFLFFAQTLAGAILTNLYLTRTCERSLGFNHSTCALLTSSNSSDESRHIQTLVQPHANLFLMTRNIIETCFPAILSFFLGPWSDLHGRKPLLFWPLVGFCTTYCLYLGSTLLPNLPPSLLLLASVPIALSGGFIAVISGMYSYMSDVTTPDNRALRIGFLDAALFSGLLFGTLCCSRIFYYAGRMGYVAVFGTSASACLLGVFYVLFILPESVNSQNRISTCCIGSDLFQGHFVTDVVRTCCKQRPNFGRAFIFLIIASLAICIMTLEGEAAVAFQFTKKKFGWDVEEYTNYAAVALLLSIVGMVSGVTVLSSWLKVPDAPLTMVAYLFKMCGSVILALSPASWFLYMGSVVNMGGALVGPLSRSILTKIVPKEDIGKVFSLTSSVEALTPLASSTLYTLIYDGTIVSFPGAFHLLSAGIFSLDFILLTVVVILERRKSAIIQDSDDDDDVDETDSDSTCIISS